MEQIAAGRMPDRLASFEGRWRVARNVTDHADGPDARFEGEAVFLADGQGLTYEETGKLTLAGLRPVVATRAYLWRDAGPGRIAILFPDGRPFHAFALAPAAEDAHFCDPDRYCVAYDFARWPDWSATWQVTGPRKNYTLVSRYAR